MRNLKLQYCKQLATSARDAKFLLIDSNGSKTNSPPIYVVTASKLYEFHNNDTVDIAEVPDIIGAEYLALTNEICLATSGGEVLLVNAETHELNEGTYCDVGLECMSWSPDQEVVAFVTKTHNVVVMTCTYDSIAEYPLSATSDVNEQFVNVGWGKKETQFHGSAGKNAAKERNEFHAPKNIDDIPQNIEVSWRADGAHFVVSFVCAAVGRTFKVFDKEGKLCYNAERLNDLQPTIAWRPSGTWIALPQQLPNKSTIALFEKNGLRHREIVLPFNLNVESVVALRWSSDSDILVIETHSESTQRQHLYLYTIGNYHWYLKQLLSFTLDDPIAVLAWDNRIGEEKTLHVLLQSGKYLVNSWHYAVHKYERSGIVGVIDGNKLLITNFTHAVIPPPMYSKELQIDAVINGCTFLANDKDELQLCLYDATHKLHLFSSPLTAPTQFEAVATLQPAEDCGEFGAVPLLLGNMLWLNEQHLLASISQHDKTLTTQLLLIALDADAAIYNVSSQLRLNGIVCALASGSSELDEYFASTLDGRIQQVALQADNSLALMNKSYVQLPQPANQLQWYSTRDYDVAGLIALRTNQCLYIGAQRIASDVTSCCLAGNYLAYTQLNVLHFLRLADLRVVNQRRIERGAKLITTIAHAARTVLQMPRGNLEAICPRVLTLELVAALLERRQYNEVMCILRKERINLNLICDHDLRSFIENLNVFLDEIQNANWLNLFLSDLQNEDFTQTMYASNYEAGKQQYPEGFKITEKVTFLCEKLCEHMEARQEVRFRLPVITAYVKTGKLEKALWLIWQTRKFDLVAAEESLKYLLYLVDVNELYNVALGTYDFGLVLFVAQKSQKDPKEFLPFLNELKTFETHYRKFKIDEHLKRYTRALQNIAQCNDNDAAARFDEALVFVKRHTLYRDALTCYAESAACYQRICLAYADYLRANGKLANASLMYERGGDLTQALLSAKNVLDWRRALVLAQYSNEHNVRDVALSMVSSLQEHGQHIVAFQLLREHGNDFAVALKVLLKGRLYVEAIFEARMHAVELLANVITPDLLSYCTLLETNLKADEELFISHKQRLSTLRAQKAKQQQNGIELDNTDDKFAALEIDESDLLSDTSSMHSTRYTGSSRGSSGKTFRSSKNRRKHERKVLSLKPGNPFEDIALIDALHNHVVKIAQQQQHVHDTCKALIELQHDVAAAALQQHYKNVLLLVQASLDEIWLPELLATQQFLTGPNIDYTQLQNEQRYALINPLKRFKPQLNVIDWEHEILR